jgi:hypothetical protein
MIFSRGIIRKPKLTELANPVIFPSLLYTKIALYQNCSIPKQRKMMLKPKIRGHGMISHEPYTYFKYNKRTCNYRSYFIHDNNNCFNNGTRISFGFCEKEKQVRDYDNNNVIQ